MKHTWEYKPDGDLEEYDMVFFTSIRVSMKAAMDVELRKIRPGDKISVEIEIVKHGQPSQDGERIQG